ncbi:MAG: glycosyltransferase, partial [Anaerolineaceae bacterium]|nr:glycosyltransferase [Anaerolineaceae bacterium]
MTEHNEHQTFKADEIPSQEISDPAVLSKTPLVSVNIVTYNHEPYIAQAIEGALMQKTNFPYEVLIGEDDSSDGTREICKEYAAKYPDKIRLFLNDRRNVIYVNEQPTGRWNFINLLKNSKGKYISFCEGDDYWHHPKKLQMQVDYLETHPECGLVHSDVVWHYVETGKIIPAHYKERKLSH